MKELISVITPAVRLEELELNRQSLATQDFKDFKWYVCSPFPYQYADVWIKDPPLNPEDYMGENKAYNQLFKYAQGELVVTLNDSIWLKSNGLSKFWEYYRTDVRSCFCFMGNHYREVKYGQGIDITYQDVRPLQYQHSVSGSTLVNFDACCSSIPMSAVRKIGFIDPVWDQFCCWGIRSFMHDVRQAGYTLNISSESTYLGQKHTKEYDPNGLWNQKFEEGRVLYEKLYGAPL
jgi:hypothetical protein